MEPTEEFEQINSICGRKENTIKKGEVASYLSQSPLQSARTGIVKGCHTGFNVFFTTSVLWQIVNLEEEERGSQDKVCQIIQAPERHKYGIRGGACKQRETEVPGKTMSNPAVPRETLQIGLYLALFTAWPGSQIYCVQTTENNLIFQSGFEILFR